MKKYQAFFVITTVATTLAACSNVSKLERVAKKTNGSDFYTVLGKEYLGVAKLSARENDKKDAEYFAKKGLQAIQKQPTYPENPLHWQVKQQALADLNTGSARLAAVLNPEALSRHPAQVASLQATYDCAVSQAEITRKPIAGSRDCNNDFLGKMAALEAQIAPPPPPPAVIETKVEEMKQQKPSAQQFEEDIIVYFDLGSHALTDESLKTLEYVAGLAKNATEYNLRVVGFTDTVSSKEFNYTLSKKRTESVADKLVQLGVDPKLIEEQFHGPDKPIRETSSDVAERINRRVEINIKGQRPIQN